MSSEETELAKYVSEKITAGYPGGDVLAVKSMLSAATVFEL